MIPVIVQDYKTNDVLMLAYMNEEAFQTTLSLGKMTYYSRSRNELWTKGMTSGHYQYVKSLSIDCDKDTILAKVPRLELPAIPATAAASTPIWEKKNTMRKIHWKYLKTSTISFWIANCIRRKALIPITSLTKGIDKILKKVGEEATEIVIAAKNPDPEEIKYEIADFLYHMMVMMVDKGITWEEVLEELSQR